MLNPDFPFPTEFFPTTTANLLFYLSVPLCFGGWFMAYTLLVRWGFKEKTFGMPIIGLCGNIGWEITFSQLLYPGYLAMYIGKTMWAVFDVFIFITIWKYAANDFQNPLIKRWVRPFTVLGVVIAVMLLAPFGLYYNDQLGYFTGWALGFLNSLMMISMLFRRNSIKGQSIYIGLSIMVGNIAAYIWTAYYPVAPGQPPIIPPVINLVFFLATVPFNILYVILFYQQARKEKVNPWKRFW